jgi:hypothetical protein
MGIVVDEPSTTAPMGPPPERPAPLLLIELRLNGSRRVLGTHPSMGGRSHGCNCGRSDPSVPADPHTNVGRQMRCVRGTPRPVESTAMRRPHQRAPPVGGAARRKDPLKAAGRCLTSRAVGRITSTRRATARRPPRNRTSPPVRSSGAPGVHTVRRASRRYTETLTGSWQPGRDAEEDDAPDDEQLFPGTGSAKFGAHAS